MSEFSSRRADHHLTSCSRCSEGHWLVLELRHASESKVVLFAGPKSATAAAPTARMWPVSFICPVANAQASAEIALEHQHGGKVLAVTVIDVDPEPASAPVTSDFSAQLMATEMEAWTAASASTGRDFCKTMITLCLAAIPVIFSVFKFLGQETAKHAWVAICGTTIGLLLLVAGALFATAMRPVYAAIDPEEFPCWRARRLARMNQALRAALVVLAIGISLSIGVFAFLLAG